MNPHNSLANSSIHSAEDLRERIDDVLHRIGGKDPAIIAVGKARQKIALEQNINRPFLEIMDRPLPVNSHQPDAGFSITVVGQYHGHVSFLDTWYSRSGSAVREYGNEFRRIEPQT